MRVWNIFRRYKSFSIILLLVVFTSSCESFFEPNQGLIVEEEQFFKDWNEFRAAELGLYALQQDLVEQIVVLGELRGDLLDVTKNANRDLIEVNNFNITAGNKYGSPLNFYKLIGACNRLAIKLETEHPEVLSNSLPTKYDRLYGEVLCMRAWAYFNAVKIFKEIPYIWQPLTTTEEINAYVSSGKTILDSIKIEYGANGYDNDTIYNNTVVLERMYLDLPAIVDTFTQQLKKKVKVVGVIQNQVNNDPTWDATIWTEPSMNCLLGQMYLEVGNFGAAIDHFKKIVSYQKYYEVVGNIRFGLGAKFKNENWKNIFTGIDVEEHILTLWFNKAYEQQNNLQYMFSQLPPNRYMLKPTRAAVDKWETIWSKFEIVTNTDWSKTYMSVQGYPGDFNRGYNVSYQYVKNGVPMESSMVQNMLLLKSKGNFKAVNEMMEGVDTIVNKFTIGKNSFDQDANFPIYRAASIHLYYAEIYSRWIFPDASGVIKSAVTESLGVLNDGTFDYVPSKLGVRGRVGFGKSFDAISLSDPIYIRDPVTNAITGYLNYTGNLNAKQLYLEDQIIDERVRELAFEGERFYDLIRVAKRKNDPAYLADRVAAKFSGSQREKIRQLLMNEENWYIQLPK